MGAKIQAFDIFQTPLSSHYPLPLTWLCTQLFRHLIYWCALEKISLHFLTVSLKAVIYVQYRRCNKDLCVCEWVRCDWNINKIPKAIHTTPIINYQRYIPYALIHLARKFTSFFTFGRFTISSSIAVNTASNYMSNLYIYVSYCLSLFSWF